MKLKEFFTEEAHIKWHYGRVQYTADAERNETV
jgi:hypothetical protein